MKPFKPHHIKSEKKNFLAHQFFEVDTGLETSPVVASLISSSEVLFKQPVETLFL